MEKIHVTRSLHNTFTPPGDRTEKRNFIMLATLLLKENPKKAADTAHTYIRLDLEHPDAPYWSSALVYDVIPLLISDLLVARSDAHSCRTDSLKEVRTKINKGLPDHWFTEKKFKTCLNSFAAPLQTDEATKYAQPYSIGKLPTEREAFVHLKQTLFDSIKPADSTFPSDDTDIPSDIEWI